MKNTNFEQEKIGQFCPVTLKYYDATGYKNIQQLLDSYFNEYGKIKSLGQKLGHTCHDPSVIRGGGGVRLQIYLLIPR
jgi:hypothetical protein